MWKFVFEEIGREGLFIGETGLGTWRFSRELAVAQITINSLYFRDDWKKKKKKMGIKEKNEKRICKSKI